MPSVFPVGLSLIIPAERSFPSTVISRTSCALELPGELLKPTDAGPYPRPIEPKSLMAELRHQ